VVASEAASAQTALGTRLTYNVAVANGVIYKFTTTTKTAATDATGYTGLGVDANAPVIFAAQLFGQVYFVDGKERTVTGGGTKGSGIAWDPGANEMACWSEEVLYGTFPSNTSGATVHYPRLICQWRGRMVLSGIKSDPHNWFMSAKDDALDFDYSPEPQIETQAVAGNNSEAGYIGEPINCLIPYSDDILIFGCDHSIWQMTGDPMAGGRLDMITDAIGMAWGQPWCKSPSGVLYFLGTRGGLFRMVPGGKPEHLSASRIESLLNYMDFDENIVRLAWCDDMPGLYIFITPLTERPALHYFYDARNDAFFQDQYYQAFNPVAVFQLDGDSSDDRVLVLGGEDGYIRYFSPLANDDDSHTIDSHVFLGPIVVENETAPFVLSEIQAVLSRDSSKVGYRVYTGSSSEELSDVSGDMLQSDGLGWLLLSDGYPLKFSVNINGETTVISSGTLDPTKSYVANTRCRGYAAYIKLYNYTPNESWGMESVRVRLNAITTSRGRQF